MTRIFHRHPSSTPINCIASTILAYNNVYCSTPYSHYNIPFFRVPAKVTPLTRRRSATDQLPVPLLSPYPTHPLTPTSTLDYPLPHQPTVPYRPSQIERILTAKTILPTRRPTKSTIQIYFRLKNGVCTMDLFPCS